MFKNSKAFLKSIKQYVRENYGPRCKFFNVGCICCKMWYLVYDQLEDDYYLMRDIEKDKKRTGRKKK